MDEYGDEHYASLLSHGAPAAGLHRRASEKESFMLMSDKGNGAMRMLCVMQRDGLIDAATRRPYAYQLEQLLTESGDKELERRNPSIGMAFADARLSFCPERLLKQ